MEKPGKRRVQVTKYKCERIVKEAADRDRKDCPLVPENVTCHMFRHSRAMQLYRNGVEIATLSRLLGPSSVQTTMIYAYADTEMKRKAMESATNDIVDSFFSDKKKKTSKEDEEKMFWKVVGLYN